MRKQALVTGECYHIYNRGVDKRDIFSNRGDLERFVESIKEFNNIEAIGSIRNSRKSQTESKALSGEPLVSFVVFCLNPNHFHFVLRQLVDGGIAKFMQKLQGGYTYYFNAKNLRTGALFQGTFKSHHIGDDENYFSKIIAYVNKNNEIHDIPKHKRHLVFSSSLEYETGNFSLVSKKEGTMVLKMFGGIKNFRTHCREVVSIIRQERGKTSLSEEDSLPDRV